MWSYKPNWSTKASFLCIRQYGVNAITGFSIPASIAGQINKEREFKKEYCILEKIPIL